MTPDEIPESVEGMVEGLRRGAAGLDDYHLDLSLAMARTRRDVAAAHLLPETAATWQDVTLALDEVRQMRTEARCELEDLTGPPPAAVVRPLTAEELAAIEFDDTPQEPPC